MNKTALVTGGSRGIGLGIARCLGAEGCNLAICGVRKEQEVKHVIDELRSMDIDVIYCRADVSDSEDRKRLIEEIREHFGRLTTLVNNAGVAPLQLTDILNTTEESYDRVMNINLKGTYFLTQMVARWMLKQKKDYPETDYCIINIASISSIVASVNRGEYCISKAGMSMSTKLWATRLGGAGIRVFEICPGLIVTDMTARAKERYDKLIAEGITLQDRWGFPDDVGKAAAMLVRGDLPYSNGEVIMVDGGLTMQRL
jgi:NAD(P)-dependent dehydrogenase (short-subunit alcohol dehydrogenase family)